MPRSRRRVPQTRCLHNRSRNGASLSIRRSLTSCFTRTPTAPDQRHVRVLKTAWCSGKQVFGVTPSASLQITGAGLVPATGQRPWDARNVWSNTSPPIGSVQLTRRFLVYPAGGISWFRSLRRRATPTSESHCVSPALSMVCVWTPAAFVLHAIAVLRVEEPELELRFGPAYRDYRRRVPMFVPRAPGRRTKGPGAYQRMHQPARRPKAGSERATGDAQAFVPRDGSSVLKSSDFANAEGDRAGPLGAFLGRAKVKRRSAGLLETRRLWVRSCNPPKKGLSSTFPRGGNTGVQPGKGQDCENREESKTP